MSVMSVFKIKDAHTGLYLSGALGRNPRWTKRGRVWANRAAMRSSLNYYLAIDRNGHYEHDLKLQRSVWITKAQKSIPANWLVVEMNENGITEHSAAAWQKAAAPARVRLKTIPETKEQKIARLETRVKELEHYEKKYADILERCRTSKGPCFCGVHVTLV